MGVLNIFKKRKELTLVLDIGSSSVGGALFYAKEKETPNIIFSTVEPLVLSENITAEKLLSLTVEALSSVLKKIFSAKLGSPSKIFCVLSSPWYVSQSRIISFSKNTPFVFTNKLADSLIEKEIKIFQEQNLKKYPDMTGAIRAIELKNVKTTLNGYDISDPLNQKAKELEMTVFISMCEEKVLKKIEDAIVTYFNIGQVKFSSFAVALYTIVRDKYAKKDNFILVDVGGEVTDIVMIKKNTLSGSISFPYGSSFVLRGISVGLKCSLDEARSFFSIFKDGHMEEALAKKIHSILVEIKKEWLKRFQESLADLSHDISIPSLIFMTTDREFIDLFSEIIKTEQFTQYTLAESKFEVIPINTELLHGIAKFEDGVTRDPFLITDTVYVSRFLVNPSYK